MIWDAIDFLSRHLQPLLDLLDVPHWEPTNDND